MNDQATQLRGLMESLRSEQGEADPAVATASALSPSIATGVVSYAPICSPRAMGLGSALRVRHVTSPHRVKLARAIAISSGKGGVGKSNLAVNLAVAMSGFGLKVCLIDADLGLANADVLCNLSPRLTLEQVVAGECRLAEAMMLAPGGFRLIPGASGVARMADLGPAQRYALLEQLSALERIADVILIDCGAGISANVVGFAAAANTVAVTTTPEPTAITDGYGMIKSLCAQVRKIDISLVVNMTYSNEEGVGVFKRIDKVCRTFLERPVQFGAAIPTDNCVPQAVRQRIPFVLFAPECPATRAVQQLAAKLAGLEQTLACDDQAPSDQVGFFTRLAKWLGIVETVIEP